MSPHQVILILLARRWLIVAIFAIGTAGALAYSLLAPKKYTATVSIVVDAKPDPLFGALSQSITSPAYMLTLTEIIQSDRVASRAVKLLRLEQNPQAVERWKAETSGHVPFEYYYGALLQRSLLVKPSKGSNIIVLTYTGQEPRFAATVANAFAQALVDLTIDLRVDPARQYAAWFDERLKSLRVSLEKARGALSAYQQDKGIVATDERLDQEGSRLNALGTQLSEIQGQKVETSAREKNTGNELSPDVQQNPLILGLKGDLNKAEAKLSELSSTVGKNHPQRQQVEAQIAELRQQLQRETKRISGGAATASRAALQKEAEVRALIDAQKRRVLALRSERDQMSVLVKDVDTAERAYEAVAQRLNQTSLESKSELTNVSVLSPAQPPTEPAGSVLKNMLTAVAGSLVAGMALAMGLEMLDRRVRVPADLEAAEGVQLLGSLIPEKRRRSWRGRLSEAARGLRALRVRRKAPRGAVAA